MMGISFAAAETPLTTVTLEIEGLGNDSVQINYITSPELSSRGNPANTKVCAENGRFVVHPVIEGLNVLHFTFDKLKVDIEIPGGIVHLHLSANYIAVPVLPGDNLTIRGRVQGHHLEYEITGSKMAEEISAFRTSILSDVVAMDASYIAFSSLELDDDEAKSLETQRSSYQSKIADAAVRYVTTHTDSDASAFILLFYGNSTMLRDKFYSLSIAVREGVFGSMMEKLLK